jgi:tetratricopeptide (TPR) repeat protein
MKLTKFFMGCLAAIVLILPLANWAQETEEENARLEGRVLDLEKKPILQAEIQLKLQATGQAFSSKTNKKGEFSFRRLPPGKYALTVVKEGYKNYTGEIELAANSVPKIEISLALESTPEQKKEQEAISSFKKGIELVQENKIEEAIQTFQKAAELKPDLVEAYINIGILLFQQQKDDEAEKALLKVQELKPGEPRSKEVLGNIYFEKSKALLQQEKIDEAIEKLKLSFDYNPNYSYTRYLLGYAYTKKGMKDEAISQFEVFLQLEPNAPQAAKVKEILDSLKKK